jgi:hypothetical protein
MQKDIFKMIKIFQTTMKCYFGYGLIKLLEIDVPAKNSTSASVTFGNITQSVTRRYSLSISYSISFLHDFGPTMWQMLEMGAVFVHSKVHLDVKNFSVIIGCIAYTVLSLLLFAKQTAIISVGSSLMRASLPK